MKYFEVTLNQFCDFTTKNNLARFNCAHSIFKQITSDFDKKQDYWLKLRNRIRRVLRTTGLANALDGLENEVPKDRCANYKSMVNALKKFWGRKKFERVDLTSKIWKQGRVRIKVFPQLCYSYRNKVYIVDLYLHINESDKLNKRGADMILQVMHDALRYGTDVSIELLDVARNHIFKYQDKNQKKLSVLVQAEAQELGDLLETISNMNA